MIKRSLATKKILENLSAGIANSEGKSQHAALKLLTAAPQHRKQYVFVTESVEQLSKIGKHKNKLLVSRLLEELHSTYVSGIDHAAKESETLALKPMLKESTVTSMDSLVEKFFVLTEIWSAEQRAKSTGKMVGATLIAEKVVMTEDVVDTAVEQGEEETASAEADAGIESDDLNESAYPLGLLLGIATNHFNKEYSGLLSEAQMTFLTNYITAEPDVFIVKNLIPLEEQATKALGSLTESDAVSKSGTLLSMISKFRGSREVFSETKHPQHNAAMNFYLSLVELVDRINSK